MSSDTSDAPQSQVLNNPDLLDEIFSFFHVPGPQADSDSLGRIPFPDSQHLLWAALVSKDFCDPALKVLWGSLDSWIPLLSLIPVLNIDGSNIVS